MSAVNDSFTRPDGPLGTAPTGQAWSTLRGTVAVKTARAFATPGSATGGAALAVVDADTGAGDATVSATCAYASDYEGGHALYFRVVDANNWWRLTVRRWAQSGSYPTGTYTCQEYYGPTGQTSGSPYQSSTDRSSYDPNGFYSSCSANYNYYTNYFWELRLERCVAGTITAVQTVDTAGVRPNALTVKALGSAISCFFNNGTTAVLTTSSTTFATATKHGLGYSTTTDYQNTLGMDDFSVVPVNSPPTAPTGLAPASGAIDRTVPQRLSWTPNDPDTGDTSSKFDVQYRPASTSTWTTVTVTTTSAFWDAPASTFAAGDVEWQVRTYDSQGVASPWSASAFFTAANPPAGPSFTYPTNGVSLPASTAVATFSYPTLQEFQWRVLADNAGAAADPAVPANVLNAGATVTDPTARGFTVTGLANGVTVHLQLRVKSGGLYSAWVDSRNPVSYTPPAIPTLTLSGVDTTGYSVPDSIRVDIAHPTPTGSQPTVTASDLYRRRTGAAVGERIAPSIGSSHTDGTVWSGVDYEYRAVALGANGTSSTSAWTG